MATIRSYAGPHKGLRNILSQFIFKAGQTDPSKPEQLESLKTLGENMFRLLNDHVHHENESTLTHLEAKVKGAAAHDYHDHEELEKVQHDLEVKLKNLNSTASAEDMHIFYLDAAHFYALYLLHIHHEETVTETLLQENFTNEELMQQHLEVIQNIDFPTLMLWMQYMIPSHTEEEAVNMLSGIKTNASPEDFKAVLTSLKTEMPEENYNSLLSRL